MAKSADIVRHWDPGPDENPWVSGKPACETLKLVPHDPKWAVMYECLAAEIHDLMGDRALGIDHIGSTAVPDLLAKPVFDIDLTVMEPGDEDTYAPYLQANGYKLVIREPSWHQHRCFYLDSPRVNLHVFGPDCAEVIRHRMFKAWLIEHENDRRLYEQAKLQALGKAQDMATYNQHKQAAIRDIYQRMFRAAGLID